ncbi:trypco2 family protein [Embleya sp. NPDC008237]|uniref:trypco2 family protein n=1 Tax=Embleya sp. NPDC008237 TaxID=3363978 RepID=UPI0036E0CA63
MIELSKMIQDLRAEIGTAVTAAAGESIQFELGTIVLETHVEMKLDAAVKGKVRFWVAETNAEVGVSRGSLHKITVPLTPVIVDPANPSTPPRSAKVSGQAQQNED